MLFGNDDLENSDKAEILVIVNLREYALILTDKKSGLHGLPSIIASI